MITVGSAALEVYGMNRREPKDVDIWFAEGTDLSDVIGDVCELPMYILELVITDGRGNATPDSVYTIKCSHFAWDIHWEKTKNDIIWLKAMGCKLIPELYHALKKHWEKVHGDKSFLSLSQDKDEFFNDHVKYVYDHDYLHEVVAYPNEPMYNRCLKDGEQVLIDKEKFWQMPFGDQVRMFREEVSVIAIERFLVNEHWNVSWYEAYMMALKKTITRLTKNWANDFMVLNLEKFVTPDFSYFKNAYRELEELTMTQAISTERLEEILETQKYMENLEELVLNMADGDFDPYPREVYDRAKKEAGERTNKEEWEHLPYLDSHRREKSAEYYSILSELTKKYKEEYGKFIDYEHLQQEGGGEGGSEYCYGVFRLDGKIYRAEWSYYSHHGYETHGILNTLTEVTPRQKTITVYE